MRLMGGRGVGEWGVEGIRMGGVISEVGWLTQRPCGPLIISKRCTKSSLNDGLEAYTKALRVH